ncbi:uncharacterized protein LOC131850010 [Achroia grisella]|uniref:uncharacterized protein LOC131850010 n=1 Tax=Achroia grisella TaxID=688607 RepID=UPI0027D33F7A|nr:uncharacterized protein LOC131850010 [Achroia grisella]
MKAYILLIIFMFKTLTCEKYEYSYNVGTVLFSPLDTRKPYWSKTDISLLRARLYFQKLLPPPNVKSTSINNYIDSLLGYIRNTYMTIKREALDARSDNIMITAFCDTIGGYLKAWIVPITRHGYYAGLVSQDNALKIFNFYEDIKSYMQTDGRGWKHPDSNIQNSMNIVVPKYHPKTCRINNACQKIAFFEKTASGLKVPIPYINWDENVKTMFVPLRNQSLISLNSSDSSKALFQYYDAARCCIREIDTADPYDFDKRLQLWLFRDIIPHLNDDQLYLALNSVLTLINDTQALPEMKPTDKPCVSYIPISFSSKKFIIVIVILLLEIVWCIPAFLYVTICSRKRKKSCNSNVFLFVDSHNDTDGRFSNTTTKSNDTSKKYIRGNAGKSQISEHDTSSKNVRVPSDTWCDNNGFKIQQKPRLRHVEVKTPFSERIPSKYSIGTGTHSHVYTKVSSADIVTVVNESKVGIIKSSINSIYTHKNVIASADKAEIKILNIHNCTSNQTKLDQSISSKSESSKSISKKEILCDCNCTPVNSTKTESFVTIHELEPRKTITLFKGLETSKESIEYPSLSVPHLTAPIENNQTKAFLDGDLVREIQDEKCPCMSCINDQPLLCINKVNKTQHKLSIRKPTHTEKVTKLEKCTKFKLPIQTKSNKQQGLRLSSGNPYLEIKIDRPHAEISVGIGETCKPKTDKNNKASRIPKRAVKDKVVRVNYETSRRTPLTSTKQRSMLPQPKKRPVDDIVITSNKITSHGRLNATL